MARETHIQVISGLLERDGRISRNQCLSMYISRLASRIDDLERAGWVFRTERAINGDYVYHLVSKPAPKQLTLV